MSSYKKRKKARKAREKGEDEDIAHGRLLRGTAGPEALYEMKIDLRKATFMMCILIDRGTNEYITNVSNDWDVRDWAFLLIQMKNQFTGFDEIMRLVLEHDDWVVDPGTLFPEGVG